MRTIQESSNQQQINSGVSVTPNDSADITGIPADGAFVWATTAAGIAAVVTSEGDTIDIYLALGSIFPCKVVRVKATGTAATGIYAGWWTA